MNKDWIDCLAQADAKEDGSHFVSPTADIEAARSATVVVPLLDFGTIRIAGDDAAPFLHNLLTNDIIALPADGIRFAGLCTAKGRLIASMHVWHDRNDDLLAMISADILPEILKKLSMYVLRSKAKLTDATDERILIGLSGPQAEAILQALDATIPFPLQAVPFEDGQLLRLDAARFVFVVAPAAAPALWTRLAADAVPAGTLAWRWLEIAAGQPRIVATTQEAFVPQMVNMEVPAVGGVSFTKGCYPGQEIVARTQYLGKVKRRMYRAQISGATAPGVHLYAPETGDQHCGTVAMVVPTGNGVGACLVVVQQSCVEAGDVRLERPDGPKVEFLDLPYAIA